MRRIDLAIPGLALLEPRVFSDERGWFLESWNRRTLAGLGIEADFVQDNHSRSARGTVRGLHYQVRQAQDKLVRVVAGAIFDVCVDLRRGSPTFGQALGIELNAQDRRELWVPKGFAHGFLVLSEAAEVVYKVTDYWAREWERGVRWNDPALGVRWPQIGIEPHANARDAALPDVAAIPAADLP